MAFYKFLQICFLKQISKCLEMAVMSAFLSTESKFLINGIICLKEAIHQVQRPVFLKVKYK